MGEKRRLQATNNMITCVCYTFINFRTKQHCFKTSLCKNQNSSNRLLHISKKHGTYKWLSVPLINRQQKLLMLKNRSLKLSFLKIKSALLDVFTKHASAHRVRLRVDLIPFTLRSFYFSLDLINLRYTIPYLVIHPRLFAFVFLLNSLLFTHFLKISCNATWLSMYIFLWCVF